MMLHIRIFGKNILYLYDHYIMAINSNQLKHKDIGFEFYIEKITIDNCSDCENTSFSIDIMKDYLINQSNTVGYSLEKLVRTLL